MMQAWKRCGWSVVVLVLAMELPAQAGALGSANSVPSAADGFIDMGGGLYPQTGSIASGTPQPWYTSSQVASLFGGTPSSQQQADFTNTVLQDVEQTFRLSGVAVNLTTNPGVSAAHTLSVVSNSSSIPFPAAIGTTDIGGNGFSFIDQEAKLAQNTNQLGWIVAHNIAHELMLAFGVPENYDQSGNSIDSTRANQSMLTNPNATFSSAAALAINQALHHPSTTLMTSSVLSNSTAALAINHPLHQLNPTSKVSQLAQVLEPHAVPEPATLTVWGLGALALAIFAKKARSTTEK